MENITHLLDKLADHGHRSAAGKVDALTRLWLLRLLVPLGGYRRFVRERGFGDDEIAEAVGLGRWVEPEDGEFDEMAARAEVTESRQPEPYVGLAQADADSLQVKEGAPLLLTFGTRHATLAVKILPGLASGMLALPVGINGVPVVSATDKVSIAGGAA